VEKTDAATAVLAIRKPLQGERDRDSKAADGFRFALATPFLRALLLIAAPLNLAIGGVLFTLIVALQRAGTPPAVIGLVETVVAAGGLLGAFAAPAIQARLGLATLVRSICWAAVALPAGTAPLTGGLAPRGGGPPRTGRQRGAVRLPGRDHAGPPKDG
jgi:hypothetical protein